ncbi:MAG TPA: hypothetical protein VGC66_03680 [Pyrinomonadaceae bacterium]|jgi:hypothetical protein
MDLVNDPEVRDARPFHHVAVDGFWMYQLTDKGLAAKITVKSSKYYKDDELN